MAWSPDGKTLAANAAEQVIGLWDVEAGALRHRLVVQGGHAVNTPVVWSPDGNTLAPFVETRLLLWDSTTGEMLRRSQRAGSGGGYYGNDLAFSPDGKVLAIAGINNNIWRWEIASGERLAQVPTAHTRETWAMAWSPDGQRIVTGSHDGSVRIVDVASGELVRVHRGYPGPGWMRFTSLAWSPDGAALAIGEPGIGLVHVLSVVDIDAPRRSVGGSSFRVSWSPEGTKLAVKDQGPVRIYPADLSKQLWGFESAGHAPKDILDWSPNGKYLAVDGTGGRVLFHGLSSAKPIALDAKGELGNLPWSPGGKLVATVSDAKIRLWDAEQAALIHTLTGHSGPIHRLAWSADGKLLASASHDNTVRLWVVASGQNLLGKVLDQRSSVLAFSPDGAQLACGTDAKGGIGFVWDVQTGSTIARLKGRANLLSFSSDSNQLTTVDADNTVRHWDLKGSGLLAEHQAHPSESRIIQLSPDGQVAASVTAGFAVHLWRVSDGLPIATMALLGRDILYISPDGHYRTTLPAIGELIYVVQTDEGQQILTPVQFAQRYHWKNDPSRVRLIGRGTGMPAIADQAATTSVLTPMQPGRLRRSENAPIIIDLGKGIKMEFVLIRPGSFMMGSNQWEVNEEPVHKVTITKAFYMGKDEVTQEQFYAVTDSRRGHFDGVNLPAEGVARGDAMKFCRNLSAKTGMQVTLPTEAQWEYACRAGSTTAFHFGDSLSTDQANYDGRHTREAFRGKPTPVGTFQPNAWGLYDMHGNVWE